MSTGLASTTLAMIAGWGFNAGVWTSLAAKLGPDINPLTYALPDIGGEVQDPKQILARSTEVLLAEAPPATVWLGWSLGGLVALNIAANQPARVDKLILVGGFARFVGGDDHPMGTDPMVFNEFCRNFADDPQATMTRFVASQCLDKKQAKRLRPYLMLSDAESTAAMKRGLLLLRSADVRPLLSKIHCPVLIVHGEQDAIVDPRNAQQLAKSLTNSRLITLKCTGHAPFIENEPAFAAVITEFIHE